MSDMTSFPRMQRAAELTASSFDENANTIDVIFTAGATVRRMSWMDGPFDEELIVNKNAVRLGRLNAGAPFLNTHNDWDLSDVIGSVTPGSARIDAGKGYATIQLTRRPDAAGVVQDIRDGVIRNISVGYAIHTVEKTERDGQVPLHRVIDWEPMEISAVPVPADPGAQVRSAEKGERFPCRFIITGTAAALRSRMIMERKRRIA